MASSSKVGVVNRSSISFSSEFTLNEDQLRMLELMTRWDQSKLADHILKFICENPGTQFKKNFMEFMKAIEIQVRPALSEISKAREDLTKAEQERKRVIQ